MLLGEPAMLIKRMKLHRVELRKILCDMVGQGGVDVIAAEQNVITDRTAAQGNLTPFIFNRDECKISSAATNIDHQYQIANGDQFSPVRVVRDPCVERSLRLFEKDDLVIACLL